MNTSEPLPFFGSPKPGYWSRRQFLHRAGSGAGLLALAALLGETGAASLATAAAGPPSTHPLAPRPGHFPAKGKAVIWIFLNGGPSQVDTWDYKPALAKWDGKPLDKLDKRTAFFINNLGGLMKSPFSFAQQGQSGTWTSEIFPHLAKHVDEMAFIHSCHAESNNHTPALFQINTGFTRQGMPCMGSWISYGLGSESRNLPGFVVMTDTLGRGYPKGYAQNWSAGFLPGVYEGTALNIRGAPINNLVRRAGMTDAQQRAQLDLFRRLNEEHLAAAPDESQLNTRIESFELAYQMQMAAPEALDVERESDAVKKLYGLDQKHCAHFAKQCLMARRLVERGVRFVQIYSGGEANQKSWDGHRDIKGNHSQFAMETDQPVAALLADLRSRGLFDSTLVLACGEFGRLPVSQPGRIPGRDHNPRAFTTWLAGGGVKGGVHYGETDEFGYEAAIDKVNIHDIHATVLHLMGLDHEQLTYRFNGRDFRLTDVSGEVVHAVLA
jgi:hypothetical protein